MSMPKTPTRREMIKVCSDAGRKARQWFGRKNPVEYKNGDNTPLTMADKEVNRHLLSWVTTNFPELWFISEEGNGGAADSDWRIVVDPIDGTYPFTYGLPVFSVVMTLMHELEPICTVIHDPMLNRTWSGGGGRGVFYEDTTGEISISAISGAQDIQPSVQIVKWAEIISKIDLYKVEKLLETRHQGEDRITSLNAGTLALMAGPMAEGKMSATVFAGDFARETVAMQCLLEGLGFVCTDLDGVPLQYELGQRSDGSLDIMLPNGAVIGRPEIHYLLLQVIEEVRSGI